MNKNETLTIIRSLLSSTNSSYSIHKLNRDFRNETGIDIPLFGYNNINDFLQSITDTVKVSGIYPIQQVSLVSSEKSAHIVSLVQRQRCTEQRKKLSFKNNSGLRKSAVDTRSKGVHEHQQLLRETMLDNCKTQNCKPSGNILSFETKMFLENEAYPCPANYSYGDVPVQNFLEFEDNVPCIDVKHHAQVGEYVEVCPCRIFSPHKFFFKFRKFSRKFSAFTKELQIFYNNHNGIPNLTHEVIKPKKICVVLYKIHIKPMWHRAEIQEILKDSFVLVNFIDSGNTARISNKNLKYLHPDFRSFPRQAYLGSLANIKPLKSNWSSAAIKRFFELSFKKELVAGVVEINSEDFFMNMTLSYTKGVEIHINDTLVAEGYAYFNDEILDSHTAAVPKNPNFCTTAELIFSEDGISSETVKCNTKATESNVFSKTCTPVFCFSTNFYGNRKLKNMFSFVDKTLDCWNQISV